MRYLVYKVVHGENIRWYARQLMEGEVAPNSVVYTGKDARLRAFRKARQLNEQAGRLALAA